MFARVCELMAERGCATPVLVGGAAVELYTGSEIMTGDFDVVAASQDDFEAVLRSLGFSKPEGIGHTPLGWVHPDLLFGFEVVSASLLDGMADPARVLLVDLKPEGEAAIMSVEDMIADRLGQFASGTAPEMLDQARRLFAVSRDLDLDYLEQRTRYESGGDHGVADLQR